MTGVYEEDEQGNFVVMVELILPFRLGLCPKRLLYPEASPMSQARRLGLPPTPHIITYTVPDAALAVDTKIIATFAHPIPPYPPLPRHRLWRLLHAHKTGGWATRGPPTCHRE